MGNRFYIFVFERRPVRYNYTIINLYNRSVVATLTGSRMTGEVAKETLSRALKGCSGVKNLILQSDQRSPYTSRVFCEYCERAEIIQSMSQAGRLYNKLCKRKKHRRLEL